MPHRKIIVITSVLVGIVIFFMHCIGEDSLAESDPRGKMYAAPGSCGDCHKDITNTYLHTNHYKTSSPASYNELRKFINDTNKKFYYADSSSVILGERHSAFFQSHLDGGKMVRSEKLDIAFGSAEKAQTYAYWKGDQLFQLPLTYLTERKTWTNSPGYPIQKPFFGRVILARCFECHASFVGKTDVKTGPLEMTEKLAPNSIVFGIDCQRCHGPAAEHVAFHQENPSVKQAKFMVSVKSLTRQQQLDMCAACHSGNDLDVQRTLFAFRPGDTLANFFLPHFGSGKANPDVHGRQMQLLQASKCFQASSMTCNSCHNTHEAEENKQPVFIAKCMACHQNSPHAVQLQTSSSSCIDCHMPRQASNALDFNNASQRSSIPYMLRTHRIAIYPSTGNGK
jgi:hypothetical protein